MIKIVSLLLIPLPLGEIIAWLKLRTRYAEAARGRRRLVGAVALVLLAVIVLADGVRSGAAPRPRRPVSVRIPARTKTAFHPQAESRPREEAGEWKRNSSCRWASLPNPDSVVAKLAAAKIPYYTEAVKGQSRSRAAPVRFDERCSGRKP